MYERFFDLRTRPFELTPDPRFLLLTAQHREALSSLEYGLAAAKPLTLLVGEAGTGKSTLLRAALASERCRHVTCVTISNPTLTRDEFLRTVALRFALGEEATQSKAVLLELLEAQLRVQRARGGIVALIVDEAQRLSPELLEEIRLLGNIETAEEKLLPLVLAGQPELGSRLEQPEFRQLKQRVAIRTSIVPLTLDETATYIAHRITVAGGAPSRVFTQEAVGAIHDAAAGIPRSVNVICDNALLTGMALERRPVDRRIVAEVCHGLSLGPGDPAAPPPAGAVAEEDDPADPSTPRKTGDAPDSEAEMRARRPRFALFARPRS
jgi:general secretion pathway protein A